MKQKLFSILALLLMAATGAWATDYTTLAVGDVIKVGDTFSPTADGAFYNEFGVSSDKTYTLIRADVDNDYNVTEKTDGAYYVFKYASIMSSPYIHFEKDFAVTPISDGLVVTEIKDIKGMQCYNLALHEPTPAGYTVSLKDGVKDADKWTVKVDDGQAQALPIGGLKGNGSETVTLQYTGRLKVKGVKATSDAAQAEATPALSISSPSVGQVIGSDGKNYAYGSLPSGVTAVAKICYVSGSNGLALALTDEGYMDWSKAQTTCAAHTPAFTGGTWKLATKDEWDNMINAAGRDDDLRDGFSSVGGTNMEEEFYWSSTESGSGGAWLIYFNGGDWSDGSTGSDFYVRACLAFTVEQAPAKEPATVTTAPTGAAIVGVGKTTALVSGGVADGGTLMYAVTTTNTKPASTDGFSDAVPTAKDITTSGKVYVWYYVKGEGTHTDSEIAATAIEVPVADIVWDVTNVSDIYVGGDSYMKEDVTLSANAEDIHAGWNDTGDPKTEGISFQVFETGGYTFTALDSKKFTKIEMTLIGSEGWDIADLGMGWKFDGDFLNEIFTVTWTGSATTTDALLPDTDDFVGANVISIAFYLSE